MTFDEVREIALRLPEVEEVTSWGVPAFKIHGQMFACIASHKSAEPGTLVIRMDFDRRDELIANDPDVYYLKEHYVSYPSVLVRIARAHPDAMRDLLGGAYQYVMAKVRPRKTAVTAKRKRVRPK